MRKLTLLLMVGALGHALWYSDGDGYNAVAREMAIDRLPAAQLHKDVMVQEARMEEARSPALPRGMLIVLPQTGKELTPLSTLT